MIDIPKIPIGTIADAIKHYWMEDFSPMVIISTKSENLLWRIILGKNKLQIYFLFVKVYDKSQIFIVDM
jgi:hypothetical protein